MNVYGKNDEGEATYPYEQQFEAVQEEDLQLNQDATKTSGSPFFSILIWSLSTVFVRCRSVATVMWKSRTVT